MLSRYEMAAPQSEMEQCDSMRYLWERLQTTAANVSNNLLEIQAPFKQSLIKNVITFNADCKDFYQSYREVSFRYTFII